MRPPGPRSVTEAREYILGQAPRHITLLWRAEIDVRASRRWRTYRASSFVTIRRRRRQFQRSPNLRQFLSGDSCESPWIASTVLYRQLATVHSFCQVCHKKLPGTQSKTCFSAISYRCEMVNNVAAARSPTSAVTMTSVLLAHY